MSHARARFLSHAGIYIPICAIITTYDVVQIYSVGNLESFFGIYYLGMYCKYMSNKYSTP